MRYKLYTHAKINLDLKIVNKLHDGFHNIKSVFQAVSLADQLYIEPASKFNIECNSPEVPLNNDNILAKIYNAYRSQIRTGFRIRLIKNIPMGAGLGGGSSNAAGFLYYLIQNKMIPPTEAINAAKRFGADITFFLSNSGKAEVTGIGEIVHPLKYELYYYILIYPNINCNTKLVYEKYDKRIDLNLSNEANELKEAAFMQYPNLVLIEQSILNYGVQEVFMSGSGSTFFIPMQNKLKAASLFKQLKKKLFEYKIFLVQSIKKPIVYESF